MTNAADPEQFLFDSLDKAVEKYRAESKRLKRWSFSLRITLLLLSGTSTILLGLNVTPDNGYALWSRNAALVLGAVSTFVVGLSAFWNLEQYWLKQKVLFARLRALRERCHFEQAKTGHLSIEEIEHAFQEFRALMDDRIEYWERVASTNSISTTPLETKRSESSAVAQ